MTMLATCHCGATQIELPHLPQSIKSCNCSFCSRVGAIWGYYPSGQLKFLAQDDERNYAPRGMNNHHFCGVCGVHTWGDSPDWSTLYNLDGSPKAGVTPGSIPTTRSYAVNLRLIDGLDLSSLDIESVDGRNSW